MRRGTRSLAALVAALALAACTAAPPAQHVGRWGVDPLADPAGFHPPDLSSTANYAAILHVETDDRFNADALVLLGPYGSSPNSLGFYVEPSHSASGECEIYLRAGEVRADNWRALGAELHHEIAHCEYGHWHVAE